MRESASTDLREPQGSNPLGPPGPELRVLVSKPGIITRADGVYCKLQYCASVI